MNNDTIQKQSFEAANPEPVVRTLRLLRAGPLQFGIFTDEIAAVAAWREPTPLPQAPKSVLGVVSIEGRMLTVLDLARLPAGEAPTNDVAAQHLIALRGDEQLALAVDALGETIKVSDSELNARNNGASVVLAVLQREGEEINILNLRELFPAAIQGRERRRRRF